VRGDALAIAADDQQICALRLFRNPIVRDALPCIGGGLQTVAASALGEAAGSGIRARTEVGAQLSFGEGRKLEPD
jgi:hypothetical protein